MESPRLKIQHQKIRFDSEINKRLGTEVKRLLNQRHSKKKYTTEAQRVKTVT